MKYKLWNIGEGRHVACVGNGLKRKWTIVHIYVLLAKQCLFTYSGTNRLVSDNYKFMCSC